MKPKTGRRRIDIMRQRAGRLLTRAGSWVGRGSYDGTAIASDWMREQAA